ncbi:MAG: fibronectin type III domain-containing protein [Candidatus Diapherotrites archaeon]
MRLVFFVLACFVFFSVVFADVPVLTSFSHVDNKWVRSSYISGKVSFPNAIEFAYVIDKFPDTIPEVGKENVVVIKPSNYSVSFGSKIDGVYYFHIRARTSSGWSDTKHVKLMIDTTPPSSVGKPEVVALEDGTINIEWAPSTDVASGLRGYDVYRSNLRFVKDGELFRDFRIDDPTTIKVASNLKSTSFHDTNVMVGKGFYYHYRVVAVDDANNSSNPSPIASVKAASFCDFIPSITVSKLDKNVLVSVVSSSNFIDGKLLVISPTGKEIILGNNIDGKFFDANFSFVGLEDGDYNFFFSSKDNRLNNCNAQKSYFYDTILPEVKILSPPHTMELSNVVRFVFVASDSGVRPSGVKEVSLFIVKDSNEVKIGSASFVDNKYVFDWNTINFDNGRFVVVARVIDNVGNVGEDSKVYSIKNTFFARVGAEASISSAEALRKDVNKAFVLLSNLGIDTSDLNALIFRADSNLSEAKVLLAKGVRFDEVSALSSSAFKDYNSVLSVQVVSYGVGSAKYELPQFEVLFKGAGFSDKLISDSLDLTKKVLPSRKVHVKKVILPKKVIYRAFVEISFSKSDFNFSNDGFFVVESIPKNFIRDSSELFSLSKFVVLEEDPVVAFFVDSNANSVSYSLDVDLNKSQADALLSSKVWALYDSPPLVLDKDPKPYFQKGVLSDLPSLSNVDVKSDSKVLLVGGFAALVLFFIVFLIVVVVGLIAYFVFFKKKV